MKLEFDSVDDLDIFLHWADKYRRASAAAPQGVAGSVGDVIGARLEAAGSTYTAGDGSPADQEARTMQLGPYTVGDGGVGVGGSSGTAGGSDAGKTQPTEPVKRKRRTKAEIEADEEAAKAAAADAVRTAGASVAAEGTNPFEAAADDTKVGTLNDGTAPTGDAAGEEVVTPFQHLTRAREFIGKHGMQKYNESFAKAGLDPNVMTYTAYQRALHIDALNALEAA